MAVALLQFFDKSSQASQHNNQKDQHSITDRTHFESLKTSHNWMSTWTRTCQPLHTKIWLLAFRRLSALNAFSLGVLWPHAHSAIAFRRLSALNAFSLAFLPHPPTLSVKLWFDIPSLIEFLHDWLNVHSVLYGGTSDPTKLITKPSAQLKLSRNATCSENMQW